MEKENAFEQLEPGIYAALETYSNVHRGSGFNSQVFPFAMVIRAYERILITY
jgi:hypothetical protein